MTDVAVFEGDDGYVGRNRETGLLGGAYDVNGISIADAEGRKWPGKLAERYFEIGVPVGVNGDPESFQGRMGIERCTSAIMKIFKPCRRERASDMHEQKVPMTESLHFAHGQVPTLPVVFTDVDGIDRAIAQSDERPIPIAKRGDSGRLPGLCDDPDGICFR